MREKKESHSWTVYEFKEREFHEKLGIPWDKMIISVHTYGSTITIYTSDKNK